MTKHRLGIIVKPVGFIAGLIFLLILASHLFLPPINVDPRKPSNVGIRIEPENSLEYLVVGDSLAYRTVSPMEIWSDSGFTGYNCGFAAQRVQEAYYLLQTVLKSQTPKVILFETNELFRSKKRYVEENLVFEAVLKKHLPVFQEHNNWKKINPFKMKLVYKKSDPNYSKGFRRATELTPYKKGNYIKKTDKKRDIDFWQKHYFDLILNLCKENDIKLVLFSAPSALSWQYNKHNYVSQLAKESGLDFVDLNLKAEEVGIDWSTDTTDGGDHLNFRGSQKVSKFLADYLRGLNILTDRRHSTEFSRWNEDLETYLYVNEHHFPSELKSDLDTPPSPDE